jgi:peptide deformylase
MILRVTQYGEPILRQSGKRVEKFDAKLRELAENMIETMYEEAGVGLAAQQIDEALMLCVIDVSDLDEADLHYELDGKRPPIDLIMPMVLVNPVVRLLPGRTVSGEEGCLSFPGLRGDVVRSDAVEVEYQDLEGAAHVLRAQGWFARVIQHEYDHLKGVLFIDHMDTRDLRRLDSKLKRLKRASRDFLAAQKKQDPASDG